MRDVGHEFPADGLEFSQTRHVMQNQKNPVGPFPGRGLQGGGRDRQMASVRPTMNR